MKNSTFKLAIFDMDGTVFESHLDWSYIKKRMNLDNKNILKEIYKNNTIDYPRLHILEKYEKENTLKTKPILGIEEFLFFLMSNKITLTLTTNNNKKNTEYLLNKYNLNFKTVITREMKLWKPDPDAFIYLMKLYNHYPEETMVIGDSIYDIAAAKKAKIPNIFIKKSQSLQKNSQDNNTCYQELQLDSFFFPFMFPRIKVLNLPHEEKQPPSSNLFSFR